MIVSPASVSMLVDQLQEQRSPHGWVKMVGDWVLRQTSYANSIRPALSVAFEEFMLPPQRLAQRFGVGLRQFERRFVSVYGQNLRDMRKIARFVNALTVVMTGGEPAGRLAQIAVDLGYFDQPHMTRDFMELAGATPGRLIGGAAELDPALSVMQYGACDLRLLRSANERDCRFTAHS
jgi:AraC-like DNA-binding protein